MSAVAPMPERVFADGTTRFSPIPGYWVEQADSDVVGRTLDVYTDFGRYLGSVRRDGKAPILVFESNREMVESAVAAFLGWHTAVAS